MSPELDLAVSHKQTPPPQGMKAPLPSADPANIWGIQPIGPKVEDLPLASSHLPDPPPFDFDGFYREWNETQPIGKMADNHDAFASVLGFLTRPFIGQGYNTLAALNRGAASFYAHLDSIADYVEKSGFGTKEGLFKRLQETATNNADYWKERADKVGIGFLDEMISEAVGGFVPGVTKFSMDVASGYTFPYMAGAAEAENKGENPFVGGMLEAAKTATLSQLFRMMDPLAKYLKAPAMGTVFGAQEAAETPEGQRSKAFAKGFGTGVGYTIFSPGSPGERLGLNEIYRNLKEQTELPELVEAGKKTLVSERGAVGTPPEEGKGQTLPRKFLKTVEESASTEPELKDKLQNITEDAKDYYVIPNKESLDRADLRLQVEGVSNTVDYALSKAELSAEKGATFIRLIDKFQKEGNFDQAISMVEAYDMQLREAGRFVQAASIWNRLTPQGFIRWADKQLEATRDKYSWADTLISNKPESFTLSKDEKTDIFRRMTDINKMPDGIDKTDATLEMIDTVAQKVPPSVSEMVDAFRYQNMLSSPRTHMRNIGENIFNTFVTRPWDITTKGAVDYVKSTLKGAEREVYVSDVAPYMKAAINAVPNAARAFMEVMRKEHDSSIGKPELGIEAKTEFQKARTAQIPSYLTIVQRFMEASDKFNCALIAAGEVAIAKKAGASDAEAYHRGQEMAQKYLYRDKLDPKDPALSQFSKILSSLGKLAESSRKLPGMGTINKWYVPFITTPINKAIAMVEHSPLGAIRKPSTFTDETTAKIVSGSIATAVGGLFALWGETTWAPPSDEEEKKFFYASGRKPFSVKMGDTWVPLWYLGPYALAFGLPVAIKYYAHDRKQAISQDGFEKIASTIEGIAQFTGSQTSTQSIGALFSALQGDIDYSFASQSAFTAQQIIPAGSLVRFINTMLDPVYRKPKGFMEQIEQNLPGLSQKLEARMTPFYEEQKRDPRNYFLPYDIGKSEPVYDAMMPIARKEIRDKYIEYKSRILDKEYRDGKIDAKEYLEKLMESHKAIPKSLEMLNKELQGGSK